MFDARGSKRLQLLRLTMILALASRVGNATIRDGKEAEAFLSYLQNASNEVNYLAGHLYGQRSNAPNDNGRYVRYTCTDLRTVVLPDPLPANSESQQCDTFESVFESDLPQLEYKVVRLVMAALPREQAAQFASAVRSGSVVTAAWRFLQLAAAAADGMHRGTAVYRSAQEILALAVASSGGTCANRATTAQIRTVETAVACLGLSQTSLRNNPEEVNVIFPPSINEEPFHALFEVVRTSCGLLPIDVDTAVETQGQGAQPNPIVAREDKCRNLRFRPTLRFGGQRGPYRPPPS
ncbi:MAG TPA: hypothetical protein VMS43_17265 [Allosphingosinicella sp.]|nr:hypothetical protein [Allosphingosinicella sp.]